MTVTDIKIPQNDRLDFTFNATKNGSAYNLESGDKWFFLVKAKPNGTVLKRIEQTTKNFAWNKVNLDIGRYVYEIGIRFADGTKKTIVPNEQNDEKHPLFEVGISLEGE